MKHSKHTMLTHFRHAEQDEIEHEHLFDDRTLAGLAGKVEHPDDWEMFLGTLERWRDR